MLALSMLALPSYSGKSPSPTPVKLECKEMQSSGEKIKFVKQECANGIFYADGPRCNELYGECQREIYRIEIGKNSEKTIMLDMNGDLVLDSVLKINDKGRRFWVQDTYYLNELKKQFDFYILILFGPNVSSQ